MSKRLFAAIIAIVMVCSIGAIGVNAQTQEQSPAVCFLDNFLSDLKNGNIDEAFEVIEDERIQLNENVDVMTLSEEEMDQVEYIESVDHFQDSYEEEAIVEYSSLTEQGNNIITAEIVFSDGSEATVPFLVVEQDGGYVVKFTTDDLSENGYIETQEEEESAPTINPRAAVWKDDYEFWYLYGTIYGLQTFSVSQNGIRIDGYQENDAIETGWQSPAEVIYAIVEEHWYGDYVWATTSNAIVKNGSFSVTLVGKNSSQSNLKIRISNQTGAYPRSAGYGDIYSVSV